MEYRGFRIIWWPEMGWYRVTSVVACEGSRVVELSAPTLAGAWGAVDGWYSANGLS